MKPKAAMALALRLMGIWLLCQSLISVGEAWRGYSESRKMIELAQRQLATNFDVQKTVVEALPNIMRPFVAVLLLFAAGRVSAYFYGSAGNSCAECNYSRRGLPEGAPCPECGLRP